ITRLADNRIGSAGAVQQVIPMGTADGKVAGRDLVSTINQADAAGLIIGMGQGDDGIAAFGGNINTLGCPTEQDDLVLARRETMVSVIALADLVIVDERILCAVVTAINAAVENIITKAAIEDIAATAAVEDIVTAIACQQVVLAITVQDVMG